MAAADRVAEKLQIR